MSTTPSSTAPPEPRDQDLSDEVAAAAASGALAAQSESLAGTLGEYASAQWRRIKNGESGTLPVLAAIVVIIVVFQVENSKFLTAGNLVNLLTQGAAFILLGMAEVFVLLLGEIDLSAGYVGAVGASITVAIAAPAVGGHPWWIGVIAGLAACAVIGAAQGLLITLLRLPSFVVTLAGLLAFQGVLIWYLDREAGPSGGGTIAIEFDSVLYKLVNGNLGRITGWIAMAVVVAVVGALWLYRDGRRRSQGLAVPPFGLVVLKIAVLTIAGVVLVLICNVDRGTSFGAVTGVPWVVPIVLAILALWTFLLDRTRFGRYVYAIGGNAEAARRAGIKVTRIRVIAFALCSLTAGAGGIIYASRLQSMSDNVDGGQLVLYAVATAVIGGTSLFGGRGRMVHAVLGGLIIAAIANGMGLLGLSAAVQFMVTALVLLGAVTVDAVARRGRGNA
jgi:D-xylose transport system permease protein